MIGFLVFLIGIVFDYLLFRWWHSTAHSISFKKEEKERKAKEREERRERDIDFREDNY